MVSVWWIVAAAYRSAQLTVSSELSNSIIEKKCLYIILNLYKCILDSI